MSGGQFFGQFMLGRGRINAEALLRAVQHQNQHNLKIGELAVREGLLTTEAADRVNLEQRKQDKPFGQIAKSLGLLTHDQIEALFAKQKQLNVSIEDALVTVGVMSVDQVQGELAVFQAHEASERAKLAEFRTQVAWATGPAFTTCVQLTVRLLQRVADVVVREAGGRQELDRLPPADYQLGITFAGDWGAEYILRLPAAAASKIAARMLDESDPSPALTQDAMKEFANIVCGQVCGTLASSHGLSCELSPPRELPSNEGVELPGRKIVVFELASADGPVEVALSVQP